MGGMLGEFLKARRALLSPEEVGLPDHGRRRVPGLRREELAMLAGVSADYYVRLEQGRDRHPSEQVLDALARALRLEDAEVEHMRRLAGPEPARRRRRAKRERVSPVLLRLLDGWSAHPAFVLGRRMDVLAANPLALALQIPVGINIVRSVFLEPGARDFYPDWEAVAGDTVATLRGLADPEDPALIELVGELSVRSPEFARLWARHDVRFKAGGVKRIRHPLLGVLELEFESLAVNAAPGQLVVAYSAPPGSDSERALALLGTL
jgi:transcriptional regulator with XRE-family HTH domain